MLTFFLLNKNHVRARNIQASYDRPTKRNKYTQNLSCRKKRMEKELKNIKKRAIAFDFYFMFLFTIGTNRNI